MAIIIDSRRQVNKLTTPEIKSERSSCAVVIHRYDNPDIVKLLNANVTNDRQISGTQKTAEKSNLVNRSTMIIRQDIVRCSVTNDKSGIGGAFSVVIKKGKEFKNGQNTNKDVAYLKSINPGDRITIYMKRIKEISDSDLQSADSTSGLKMLGIIENVRQNEVDDPSSGNPKLEFIITGRSFGKVFDTNIFFNPVVNQSAMQTLLGAAFLTDASGTTKTLSGNTPDSVSTRLVKFYLGGQATQHSTANESWYVPQSVAQLFRPRQKNKPLSRSFVDVLNTDRIGLHHYTRNKFVNATTLPGIALITSLPTNGTVWSVLQFLQNQAANEMYTELTPDSAGRLRPSLILRQMPFSNKPKQETNVFAANTRYKGGAATDAATQKTYFTDLPKTAVVSSDVKQKSVGKSDHERINYVIVTPKIFDGISLDIAFVAGSNPPSIQRYGLKVFQTQTQYVMGSSQKQNEGLKQACSRIVSLLEDWFFLSHNLFNGTIVVDGRDDFVEVGSNLYIQDIQQLFHIEGYTHNYAMGQSGLSEYTTELRVSRGQRFDSNANKASFIGDSHTSNEPTTVVTSFVARGVK